MIQHRPNNFVPRLADFALAAIALLCVAARATAADVQLSLSSQETYVGMPIVAQITISNAKNAQPPQFPAIDGVDVESAGAASRSSQTTIINGHMTHNESLSYVFKLTPRRQQKFVVPAIKVEVDGQTFTTEPAAFVASKSETGDLLFAEVVGQRKEVFVGEPLTLTLKIWIKPYRDAKHNITLNPQQTWNLLMEDGTDWGVFRGALEDLIKQRKMVRHQEVLRPDASGVERSYYLYEIDHVIYPQQAGKLEAGNIQIAVGYPTGLRESQDFFFSRNRYSYSGFRPLLAEATVEPITIKPVPTEGMPSDYRGAIGRYEIAVQAMPTKVKVGDQITLRIQVTGGSRLDLLQAPPLTQLPQLTRGFKVTEEPLAGVVNGDMKTFVATLRPLRTDAKEIPAIPFSSFDPQTQEFVTTKSDAIPIEVSPADELALSKIISASGSSSGAASHEQPAEVINPLTWQFRGSSVLKSSQPPSDAVLLFAIAAPPLAFLGLLMAGKSCGWLRDSSMWRRRQARRLAARRLDHADSSDDVARAAFGYMADRFGLNAAPLTRRELVSELQHHGIPAVDVYQWDELLAQCEAAKYAGGMVSAPQELARRAKNCIAGIDRHCSIRGETSCSA